MAPSDDNYCIFRIERGAFNVEDLKQHECRGDNAVELMKLMVELAPEKFEGLTGRVHYGDVPPRDLKQLYDLEFCSSLWLAQPSSSLPFPCPFSLRWPQVGIPDGPQLTRDLLNYKGDWRYNTAFWIGADTHESRKVLAALSEQNPSIVNAELMKWKPRPPGTQSPSATRYVSLWDHRHYKYLIDCPGHGYSGRIRWLLASGRPLFIVERDTVESWHRHLRPWVHFIPLRSDLSDLIFSWKRLEADPALYAMISENAREFVRRRLLPEMELPRIVQMIPTPRTSNS
jgi:hypothetical protein